MGFFISGIELDSSDSLSLATSLRAYAGSSDPGSQRKFLILVSLCSKAMELARYFCTGVELPEGETEAEHFRHYALSVDLYTHFTSPIRRYPDLLVHRLLDAAIQEGGRAAKSPAWATAAVAKQAEWCNKRKLSAKMAGDDSAALFLALFVKECGPITTKAMVIQVGRARRWGNDDFSCEFVTWERRRFS
jgi:DIS3-like exonuclease 2